MVPLFHPHAYAPFALPPVSVPPVAAGSSTILLVEDDLLLAGLAADVLADEGYRVLVADDADRAEALLFGGVDFLFTDIDLARGTCGLDLARRARRRWPLLPILYASGGRWTLDAADSVDNATFLPKPYRLHDVLTVIAHALGRAG